MSYSISLFLYESIGCLPEIFLVLACMAELILTLFTTSQAPFPIESRNVVRRVAFYFVVAILLMLFYPAYHEFALNGQVFWAGAFQLNPALVYTKVIVACFVIFVLLTSSPYLAAYRVNNYEFGILLGLVGVAMFAVISAYNLMVLYLALELQALIFFILLAWRRRSRWSLDATLKYVLVNLLASVFFLLAINRCFAVAGSVSYVALANYYLPLLNVFLPEASQELLFYPELYPSFIRSFVTGSGLLQTGWWLSLMSLLIAFSLKLGVAPFHLWVPTVYSNGVVPVVSLLATGSKISYVAALSVLLGYVFYPVLSLWQWFFALTALLSVALGNLGLLGEKNLLRIVGMSSVASGGYLYLILGFAPSLYMYPLAIGYIVLSSILTCNWFLLMNTTFLAVNNDYTLDYNSNIGLRYASDLATLRYSSGHWGWALALALNLCSTAGIPPLLGFWSKFLTYTTFMQAIVPVSALSVGFLILIMLFTLVGAVTYLRLLAIVLFEEPSQIRSYLPVHWGFHLWNVFLVLLNLGIFWWLNWDNSLMSLTPYYVSDTGFMWESKELLNPVLPTLDPASIPDAVATYADLEKWWAEFTK